MNPETRDNTIADLHRIRREIAAKFHGDIFAINADAQARTEASGRQIIRRGESSNQRVQLTGASQPASPTNSESVPDGSAG